MDIIRIPAHAIDYKMNCKPPLSAFLTGGFLACVWRMALLKRICMEGTYREMAVEIYVSGKKRP